MVGFILVGSISAMVSASAQVSSPSTYFGMCDASAGMALGADTFVVANDEDNALRVYRSGRGGRPIRSFNVSRFINVDPNRPESDIEGAARLGNRIYWITSHGQNREGEFRSSRHAFFATTTGARGEIRPAGRAYRGLLADLLKDTRLDPFNLRVASQRPPKARNGLNIEGLSATPSGQLLIGFRNPIPSDRALIVPLENPAEVVQGQRARFGPPILIDLDGRGVRDIVPVPGGYLIVAGAYNGSGKNRLYRWAGGDAKPDRLGSIDLGSINAEAIVTYADNANRVQLLSDDGTRNVGGTACKSIRDPMQRRFRSVWVDLP